MCWGRVKPSSLLGQHLIGRAEFSLWGWCPWPLPRAPVLQIRCVMRTHCGTVSLVGAGDLGGCLGVCGMGLQHLVCKRNTFLSDLDPRLPPRAAPAGRQTRQLLCGSREPEQGSRGCGRPPLAPRPSQLDPSWPLPSLPGPTAACTPRAQMSLQSGASLRAPQAPLHFSPAPEPAPPWRCPLSGVCGGLCLG